MTIEAPAKTGFHIEGIPPIEQPALEQAEALTADAQPVDPLGPLAQLPGTWKGHGFNSIWRPHHPSSQDRFLECNLTTETLTFTKIDGAIPNRGLLMPDINMFGLTYLQQISQTSDNTGLHIEPGIWVNIPATSSPKEPTSVARLASIPHGTVILAQGDFQTFGPGKPNIPDNNIIPFGIGSPAPPNSAFNQNAQVFTEMDLSTSTPFRFLSPGVTQAMVRNPNSILQQVLVSQTIKSRTFLKITTKHTPIAGGGTANTAFLADAGTPPIGNAKSVEVDAMFWIETVAGTGGNPDTLQLQYSQLVELDFNNLRWPHVTVATLVKQ
jgi:hypothetical protein